MSDHEHPSGTGADEAGGEPAPPRDADGVPSDPLGEDPTQPLDGADPRFTGFTRPPTGRRSRELIASRGPGRSPMDTRVRIVRLAIPAIAVAGIVSVAAVFWAALAPDSPRVVVGDADAVASAVSERPLRVCPGEDGPPCAWLTRVDGELLALSTSGPVGAEFGRQGVGWCPSSGYLGSNTTGSRYDPAGRLVRGPGNRGLDRFRVREDDAGRLIVVFARRTVGPRAGDGEPLPRAGPACEEIPFDRDPDLELPAEG